MTMLTNSASGSTLSVVLVTVLASALIRVLALPAPPLTPNLTSLQQNASSLLVSPNTRPPEAPICPSTPEWGATLGHPSYDDCDYVLSDLYPKDPLTKPIQRNFYTAPRDVSHTMSNFKLPYEQSHGTTTLS